MLVSKHTIIVEVITGFIPIHNHLEKISGRHYLRITSLPKQYAINSLLDNYYSKNAEPYHLSIDNLMDKQCLKVKSSIVDTNNHLNEVYPSFNRLYKKLSPEFHSVDNLTFLIVSLLK